MARRADTQLTREEVVAAAATVLQRDGLEALTMRGVAAELGVQPAALYWHVRSKQALQLLLFDRLIGEMDFGPPTDDWREDLRRMAWTMRRHFAATRDVTLLFLGYGGPSPRALKPLERGLEVLRRAGLSSAEAASAYFVGFSFLTQWARMEAAALGARQSDAAAPKASLPAHLFPNVVAVIPHMASTPEALDARFAFSLDLLIAGVEAMAARTRPSGNS